MRIMIMENTLNISSIGKQLNDKYFLKEAPQKKAQRASGLGGKLLKAAAGFALDKAQGKTGYDGEVDFGKNLKVSTSYNPTGSFDGGKIFGIQAKYKF